MEPKGLIWVGSSLKDLKLFPSSVRRSFGYALYAAQMGETPTNTKPLKGFGGAGVLEVIEYHQGATYRAIYTVRFERAVYVLHAFQKKSKQGITTPKKEMDLIHERLKWVERIHAGT